MQKKLFYFILNLGFSTVHKNFVDFLFQQFLQKSRSNSSENRIRSSCIRLWYNVGAIERDIRRELVSVNALHSMSLVLKWREEGDRERRRLRFWRSQPALSFKREHPEVSDLETDPEAFEPCQFEPEVYRTMSDHNGQRQRQKTTILEVKKAPRY